MLLSLVACKDDEDEIAKAKEYQIKLSALNLEKQALLDEKHVLRNGMTAAIGHNAYMSFVFLAVDEGLYHDVLPIFEDSDIKLAGVIAFSEDEIPGMDGNLTLDQYGEMLGLGWTSTLYWKGPHEEATAEEAYIELCGFIETMRAKLADISIDMPNTMVFAPGAYTVDYDEYLESCGIITVLHDGDNDFGLIASDDPEGVWHAGIIGWRDLSRSTRLKRKVELNGGYSAFMIGFDNHEDNYATSFYPIDGESTLNGERVAVFARMIDKFRSSIQADKIHVTGIDEAREGMTAYYDARDAYLLSSEQRCAEIDILLRDVERRILELYDEYY